jgi:hypothetical protein
MSGTLHRRALRSLPERSSTAPPGPKRHALARAGRGCRARRRSRCGVPQDHPVVVAGGRDPALAERVDTADLRILSVTAASRWSSAFTGNETALAPQMSELPFGL